MPEFDGTQPVDEYLNKQVPLREKEDEANKEITGSRTRTNKVRTYEDYQADNAVFRGAVNDRENADHEARQNIRKKLGIPETPGVDAPKFDSEEYEDIEEDDMDEAAFDVES